MSSNCILRVQAPPGLSAETEAPPGPAAETEAPLVLPGVLPGPAVETPVLPGPAVEPETVSEALVSALRGLTTEINLLRQTLQPPPARLRDSRGRFTSCTPSGVTSSA